MPLPIKPEPDFNRLRRALLRDGEPDRVSMLELFADREIIAHVMGVESALPTGKIEEERWLRILIDFWHGLGYDSIWLNPGPRLPTKRIAAGDTADLKREQREWYGADVGIIQNWADFDHYPWPNTTDADFSQIELAGRILPEGMKVLVNVGGMLEPLMWLMGYSAFALTLYDDPALVQAMIDKVAEIYIPIAAEALDMECVGGLFIGDDMGFKTATMIAPDHLRQYFFPYHQRLAGMAHQCDKLYILHACGNLEAVMEDLIEDVKIDAKHSFEDIIVPVTEFKRQYGQRIGVIGGIDLDFLCRATEAEVRVRVRETLDTCMPGGGYVLGTGNSVANYIPIPNFLAMVDEGHRWRP